MTRLTLIVGLLAAIYGGYWFYGAAAVEREATAALTRLADDGWSVDYESLDTAGFPNRFDTTVKELRIAEPTTGLIWAAPILEVMALSYIPDRAIVAFAPSQTVTLPDGEVLTIATEGLRASTAFDLADGFRLEAMTAEAGPITILSDKGWRGSATRGLAAQRLVEGTTDQNDLWFDVENVALPVEWTRIIDPEGQLPDTVALVRLDSRILLDPATNDLRAVTIRDWRLDWGGISIKVTGDLIPDANGFAEGLLIVQATGWEKVIDLMVRSGTIPETSRAPWTSAFASIAKGADLVELPLSLRNGAVSLGFIPLGPSPRMP